ncbi:DUF4387 domain-containing protein [Terrisporobacter sp.]|uniref:DUF4387 domain-containing protein n=1 Tax=Terrisporobacter sp. TaxID=1965305 RepID=UPI002614DD6D|nr:DUF4387 domain-containing protein [Terrisporobacter sp.]
MTKLTDITNIIRSKNSGPYELTMDIMFKTNDDFKIACSKKIINEDLISKLYKINKENIINIVEFEPANAIKITIKRPICSGDLGETDVYGAQQHAPLLSIEF